MLLLFKFHSFIKLILLTLSIVIISCSFVFGILENFEWRFRKTYRKFSLSMVILNYHDHGPEYKIISCNFYLIVILIHIVWSDDECKWVDVQTYSNNNNNNKLQ